MKNMIIDFLNTHKDAVYSFGYKAFIALIIIIAGKILIKAGGRLIMRLSAGAVNIDETLLALLKSVLKYALIIICIIMILGVFGVNTSALVALIGTAGIAIGLALKDTLGNIAAGIMLIVLKSYRKGDFIESGAFMGTVRSFDLFTTTLETTDGVFIYAPNSTLWAVPVKNYSRNSKRRMDLPISIAYSDSLDTAFQVMREIASAETRFLAEPAPQVVVQSLGDSAVTIVLRAWAPLNVYWDIYFTQIRLVKEKIEGAGLTIPFPQRDIHIIEEKQSKSGEPKSAS